MAKKILIGHAVFATLISVYLCLHVAVLSGVVRSVDVYLSRLAIPFFVLMPLCVILTYLLNKKACAINEDLKQPPWSIIIFYTPGWMVVAEYALLAYAAILAGLAVIMESGRIGEAMLMILFGQFVLVSWMTVAAYVHVAEMNK